MGSANVADGARHHTDGPGLLAKCSTVVHGEPSFALPLVDHLMEQRVLRFLPPIVSEVPHADGDFHRSILPVQRQLSQLPAHLARDPKADATEFPIEEPGIELAVKCGEAAEEGSVFGPGLRPPGAPPNAPGVAVYGKGKDHLLRRAAPGSPGAGLDERQDGREYGVWRIGKSAVDSQNASAGEAYHDGAILVRFHVPHAAQAQGVEPSDQQLVVKQLLLQPVLHFPPGAWRTPACRCV